MRLGLALSAVMALGVASACALALSRADDSPPGPHRSPFDVAVTPDGRFALTANTTAGSLSLVDIAAGRVLAELPCGRHPTAVAITPDGRQAAVSNWLSGCVAWFELQDGQLRAAGTTPVGSEPRGLAFSSDGRWLCVAVARQDELAVLDGAAKRVVRRIPVGTEPWALERAPDGETVAVAGSRSASVSGVNVRTGAVIWTELIPGSANLRGVAYDPASGRPVVTHVVRRDFPVSKENIDEGWVINSRLTRLPGASGSHREQIALDARGSAVGDPHGIAFSADARWLIVTAPGTHELLILDRARLPWSAGDPGDHIRAALAEPDGGLRRLKLGGRPLGVAFASDAGTAVVANYLLDALQVVDVPAARVLRTIPLGGPADPGLERRGEAIFYDADRSHGHWFSCHTCHVEGHTGGLLFDTLNDDSYGNPKLVPSLRGVTHTGPWTWHGWQKDLTAAMTRSLTTTMSGPEPTADDASALVAFLATLEQPPNPHRLPDGSLGAAARRGERVFRSDAAHCSSCHKPPLYTSRSVYDVKLGDDGSPYSEYNPPSLLGVYARGPYLHDGRAKTLDELLTRHHRPDMLGGSSINDAERADLIEFLRSL
jgi:DNA-binding beta-propeller fold protein YncE